VNRSAIITGASAGIGAAVAARLLGDGWRVIGLDRREGAPDGVELVVGDAGNGSMITDALDRCDGRLDALVCSAGIPPSGPWDSREHWDEVIRVDLTAAYEALRLAMPALAAARGSAVLVGSIVGGVEGSLRSPAYAAAKAGLEGLARSMAIVAAPSGVRVNVVAPGAIDTDFDERLLPDNHRVDVALGRLGTVDEVASVVEFLVGAEAGYVTGAVWTVDGGRAVLSTADAHRSAAAAATAAPDD
jgi:meso-butanediol dehydrogenase/(S,S)-butanediol dehydrogenase/diacetyl reductase